ncbi:MAG: hypothetical protein KF752_14665 [Pirellulaceae bacterium]|nr:hypothetical protein [Pirellulaceae bacterium]
MSKEVPFHGRQAILASDLSSRSNRQGWIGICVLLIAAAVQLVRIATVQSSTGETPFLSANDRSRWCTILSLVVNGSYAIDEVIEIRDPQTNRRTWYTIDLVQHRGRDGLQHYYSSKPPLLPTVYAGVYWLVRATTGATLMAQPFLVARLMLVLVNLLPLVGLWWLLISWARRAQLDDLRFGALAAFATLGTFLSTFSNTLNNHLPAAVAAGVSLACLLRIIHHADRRRRWFALCGLSTSFLAANEMPALSWLVLVGLILLGVDWRKTLGVYAPSLVPITLAFFATNYWAHGTFRPAYSQRGLGASITTLPLSESEDVSQLDVAQLAQALAPHNIHLSPQAKIGRARRNTQLWELWDESSQWRLALKADLANQTVGIYHWGDWYDFPTSYWVDGKKQGVDIGEPSRVRYAMHCLVGHHGIFSLTPFWIFSLIGAVGIGWHWLANRQFTPDSFLLTVAIAMTSIVVLIFYWMRPVDDRNYGGVCSGLRWVFWLYPLWFWLAIAGIKSTRFTGAWTLIVTMLLVSIFSATYPWKNPWSHPWLMHWIPLSVQDSPSTAAAYPQVAVAIAAELPEKSAAPYQLARELSSHVLTIDRSPPAEA